MCVFTADELFVVETQKKPDQKLLSSLFNLWGNWVVLITESGGNIKETLQGIFSYYGQRISKVILLQIGVLL